MKKTIIFAIGGFIAGAAAGAGVTYFVVKKKFQKEAEEYREMYIRKIRSIDSAAVEDIENYEPEMSDDMSDEQKKEFYMNKLKDLGYGVFDEEEYDEMREEVNPVVDEDDRYIDENDSDNEAPTEEPIGIEELSYNEYIRTDDTNLSRLSLTYYAGDNTVADSEDEIVPNWRELIGDEWLDKLDKEHPTAYYVNHSAGLLIDIDYVEGSFKELVEGIASDEEVDA